MTFMRIVLHTLRALLFTSLTIWSLSGVAQTTTGSLQTYLQHMDVGSENDGLWQQPDTTALNLTDDVIRLLHAGHYADAHTKAQQLGGSVIAFDDNSTATTKRYYIFHIDYTALNDTAYHALSGTYVYYPQGENIAIQVPHPAFDTHTNREGFTTFTGLNARYLLISGTHRRSSPDDSQCQSDYKASDASHHDQHHFFQVHKTLSTLDSNTLFIELHGFGSTTRQALWAQCAPEENTLMVNMSAGTGDVHASGANTFMHILHNKITDAGLIHSCLYSPDKDQAATDIYSSSLGGTRNTNGRFTNGSHDVCNTAAPVATGRFLHLEQSYEVRRDHRDSMLTYLKAAWADYQNPDDDGDNMPDNWEFQYQLDGQQAADANDDPDNDKLSNREERLLGSNPRVADNGRLPHYTLYWDGIDNEWQDFSPDPDWQLHIDASRADQARYALDLQSTAVTPHSGRFSLALHPQRWRYLNLTHENIKVDSWQALEFYVHGGQAGGQQLQVRLNGSKLKNKPALTLVNINDYIEGGQVVAGEWRKVSIPLSDLTDDTQVISFISIGWLHGFDQATLCYLDDIRLVADSQPAPALQIDVDTTQIAGELPATLLGVNGAHWMTNIQDDNVVSHIKQLGSKVIRYPGGSSSDSFHWQDNNTQAPDWQTTPDEFLQLLQKSGATGMITANFGTGTAQEAQNWAQDALNKEADIGWWEIGNEIYGDWETTWTHDGTAYMQGDATHDGANDFCTAIKAVNPTTKVSMVGTLTADEANHFGSKVIGAANNCFDYYSIHYYARGPGRRNYASLLTAAHADLPVIGDNMRTLFASTPQSQHLQLALTEYNAYYTAPEDLAVQTVNMLFMADVVGQAAEQGIKVANAWSLGVTPVNPPGTRYGLLQDYLDLTRQPTYFVYPLWRQSGDKRLTATVNRFASRELAVYPSKHSDSGNITLIVINKSSKPQSGAINLNGFGAIAHVEAYTAQGTSLDAGQISFNGNNQPPIDLTQVTPLKLGAQPDSGFRHSFPPYSVSSITVYPDTNKNLAQQFGLASQGATYGNDEAAHAIDGDLSTYNHTQCNANDNWWQVKLPEASQVSRIVLTARTGWASRIDGAEIYLSDTAYNGTLNAADKVFTAARTTDPQTIELAPAQTGTYVIVKAAADNCLHMREIEIYGEAPATPYIKPHKTNYLIPHNTAAGTTLLALDAVDWQGDTLTYNIEGTTPFAIDAQGKVSVQGALQAAQRYNIAIAVSDGHHRANTTLTIDTTSTTAVEDALSSGVVTQVTENELLEAALAELATRKNTPSLLSELYGSTAIDYIPGNRTQLLNIKPWAEDTQPILIGNKGKTLAIAGTTAHNRYAAFGMSPTELFANGKSLTFQTPFKRLLAWLLAGEPVDTSALQNHRTVALSFANSDRSNIKNWLAAEQPDWTVNECTLATLSQCYNDADLIITGWQGNNSDAQTIKQTLATAMANGKPVLYVHTWYEAYNDVAQAIADLLNFSLPYGGNYWANDAAQWASAAAMQTGIWEQQGLGGIETLLTRFTLNDYAFDWHACNGENCSAVPGLDSEFQQGATKTRAIMNALDENRIDLFTSGGLRFHKLLALLGDKYRQNVHFPMDKHATDDNTFLKAYFADHAVYNYRMINPAQPDMGNFSRSDFSHITPVTKTIERTSKVRFRSAGVYALPGQTVRVTRLDNSDLTVKVFVNTQRAGSTHQWADNGYKRPKYLQSPHMQIASGETINFTSPYGGPLQLAFSANDLPVKLRFENVGEHPYWAGSADDTSFTRKLDAGEYDWAELVTPGFEVHSTLDKMLLSMGNANWGSAQALSEATMRYMHNFPHVLAGFQGPGIDRVAEIHDFAAAKGWTIDTIDLVKHMNADQATCGYGCSGNPYDAYWSFNPIGHGDVHELGHGLERNRFRFTDWEGHSQTNPYSYYTKSRFHDTTGGEPGCQSLPFETAFTALQTSKNQPDPKAYMQTHYWADSNWSHQVLLTIQTMMTVQKMGKLENGWHLLARLHIHDREMRRADNNDTQWEKQKASLGFSHYSRQEAMDTSNDDYMLLALSTVAELDLRDYLALWGLSYSEKAATQVASYGYPRPPHEFFISSGSGYCKTGINGDFLAKATLPVNGQHGWPTSTDDDSDGYWNAVDNCPAHHNPAQQNHDGDALGDQCDPDDDNDGMSDAWETANGLNPYDATDALLDDDSDGLNNLDEFNVGTDPQKTDSDGDGVNDGDEVAAGTDPNDANDHPASNAERVLPIILDLLLLQ